MTKLIAVELVASRILEIRGKKVMLDRDLAKLYGVETRILLQAVKRNLHRFPDDFMYQLAREEVTILRSQFVTSSWGGRRYLPYVFTQEGVAMLSSVLNSERAIQVNILIMRAFVRLREVLLTHKEIITKIESLEKKYSDHDKKIRDIFDAIRQLLEPPKAKERRLIGFHK